MPYARIDEVFEFHGNVQAKISMYLRPGDVKYEHTYGQVPIIPPEGYPGEVGAMGRPVDIDHYKAWRERLPKEWKHVPFNNHYVYADPDVTEVELQALIDFHLPNFYEAWKLDRIPGGMRRGWDVKHRIRPLRYEEVDEPKIFALRKAQCEQKAKFLKTLNISALSLGEGKTFPATEIDIGADASSRGADFIPEYTIVGLDNTANDTGTIDTFDIWAAEEMGGTKAGTFHGAGTDYTPRDVETIGTVTVPTNQTPQSFTGLDCDVTSGDFAGIYCDTGKIEADISGFAGIYYKSGDQFGAGEQTYTSSAGQAMSLYGSGETAVQTISEAGAIASLEAFGTHQLNFTIFPSGIASLESIGTAILAGPITVSGIASLEAFGTHRLDFTILPSGITSLEAFGTHIISITISPTGIASLEAFGTHRLDFTITITGITSLEAFGTAIAAGPITVDTGIASLEAFGTHRLDFTMLPSGITSLEAFGTHQLNFTILPSGVASLEAFGTSVFTLYILPGGIASLEAFGTPHLIIVVTPSGTLGYTIEVRTTAGVLLAIYENAFGISLTEQLNKPPMLDFSLPADDSKITHLDPDNEIWLRNYETGTLIEKFLMGRRRDVRS